MQHRLCAATIHFVEYMVLLMLTGASIVPVGTPTPHKAVVAETYDSTGTVGIATGTLIAGQGSLVYDTLSYSGLRVALNGGGGLLNKAEQLLLGKFIQQSLLLSEVPGKPSISESQSAQYIANVT